jgi:hypothetical protein
MLFVGFGQAETGEPQVSEHSVWPHQETPEPPA